MTTTLTCNGVTATLPTDLHWSDEYDWSPVEQSRTYTTTGALIIDTGTRQAGRPITLAGSDDAAWMPRSLCDTLRAWAALAAPVLVLTYRGATYDVAFDHEKTPFEARPVFQFSDPAADDWYVATLRLIEL